MTYKRIDLDLKSCVIELILVEKFRFLIAWNALTKKHTDVTIYK
ncbi:hypothetical protein [Clostridium muellerianum]|nr:hypothetical protein [Clostridium muellerianum]